MLIATQVVVMGLGEATLVNSCSRPPAEKRLTVVRPIKGALRLWGTVLRSYP